MILWTYSPSGLRTATANFGDRFAEHIAPYELAAHLLRCGVPGASKWICDVEYDCVSGNVNLLALANSGYWHRPRAAETAA